MLRPMMRQTVTLVLLVMHKPVLYSHGSICVQKLTDITY
jgi:hypothetical protein